MQVGTSTPVDDFRAMVRAGAGDRAVSGMQAAIQSLVDVALSERCRSAPRSDARAGERVCSSMASHRVSHADWCPDGWPVPEGQLQRTVAGPSQHQQQPTDHRLRIASAVARSYAKPLEAVKALREDAIARNLIADFNSFLSQLVDKCAPLHTRQPSSDGGRRPFTKMRSQLHAAVSTESCDGCGIVLAHILQFACHHTPAADSVNSFKSRACKVHCVRAFCKHVQMSDVKRSCRRYEHNKFKAGFWRRLAGAGITLISDEEAGQSVGTSAQAAADFLAHHSAQRQVKTFLLHFGVSTSTPGTLLEHSTLRVRSAQDAAETGQTKAEPTAEEDELEDME